MHLIAEKAGSIELFVMRSGQKEVVDSERVIVGEEVEFATPKTAINDILGSLFEGLNFNYYLQFTDSDGKTYRPYHLTEFN
jgi:hypothetical protein